MVMEHSSDLCQKPTVSIWPTCSTLENVQPLFRSLKKLNLLGLHIWGCIQPFALPQSDGLGVGWGSSSISFLCLGVSGTLRKGRTVGTELTFLGFTNRRRSE